MEDSLAILEAKSHAVRQKYMEKEQDDKETKNAYGRHVKNYVDWWMMSQAHLVNENPTHFQIPAFPITFAKVMMFLEHEEMRPKVCDSITCRQDLLTHEGHSESGAAMTFKGHR